MKNVLQNIINSISCGDNIVVGVSGGADSMVLLHLLLSAQKFKDFSIKVIHVEHGIRGTESLSDAKFIKDFCVNNNLDYKIINANIIDLAKKNKQTVEQCARNFRYDQFYKEAKNKGKIFIAHNKNDQAETVLMNIFRGSGVNGAAGIKQQNNIYRPLLDVTKNQIIEYAKQNNINFVTDSTNNNQDYTRNFVRHSILPVIEQIYPAAVDNICKFAKYNNTISELIDNLITAEDINFIDNCCPQDCLTKNPLIAKRIIEKLYNKCGEFLDLESKHFISVIELAQNCKNGVTINLPHGVIVEKRDNKVYFYKQTPINQNLIPFKLGETILAKGKKIMAKKIQLDQVEFGDSNYYLDYLKIPKDAVWRTRQDGDVFAKLGSGKKKLNDYFTDKKLPFEKRDNVMLLASKNNILLVLGFDVSEYVKIDDCTLQVIRISQI